MLKLLVIASLFAAATHTFQSQTPAETVAQLQKGRAEMQKTVEAAVPHVQAVMDKVIMPAVEDFKSSSVAVLQTPSVVAVATPTKVATVKQVVVMTGAITPARKIASQKPTATLNVSNKSKEKP